MKNIFEENELEEKVVISKMETTTIHGAIADKTQTTETNSYNLDAIISVGYRVNSAKATQFRIWANKILKEHMIKGFVLERVRSIRASERRIWQQITDIFAECSLDYDVNSQTKKDFFATIQNKFHYAITGQTAAEIIYQRLTVGISFF